MIPTINIDALFNDNYSEMLQTSSAMDKAFEHHGFFLATGRVVQKATSINLSHAKEFFDLLNTFKDTIQASSETGLRGYGQTYFNKFLARETLDMGKEFSVFDNRIGTSPLYHYNKYPAVLGESFQKQEVTIFEIFQNIAIKITKGLFTAKYGRWDVREPKFFEETFGWLRHLRYQSLDASLKENLKIFGEHTDLSYISLVQQEPNKTNIEICDQITGQWIEIDSSIEHSLVVFPGLLAINSGYLPTKHRVVNVSNTLRHSTSFSFHPNYNAQRPDSDGLYSSYGDYLLILNDIYKKQYS